MFAFAWDIDLKLLLLTLRICEREYMKKNIIIRLLKTVLFVTDSQLRWASKHKLQLL